MSKSEPRIRVWDVLTFSSPSISLRSELSIYEDSANYLVMLAIMVETLAPRDNGLSATIIHNGQLGEISFLFFHRWVLWRGFSVTDDSRLILTKAQKRKEHLSSQEQRHDAGWRPSDMRMSILLWEKQRMKVSKQDTKYRIYALQLGNANTNIEMSSVNKISITNNL